MKRWASNLSSRKIIVMKSQLVGSVKGDMEDPRKKIDVKWVFFFFLVLRGCGC